MEITKDLQLKIEAEISRLISEGLNDKTLVAKISGLRKNFDFETTSLIIDQAMLRPKASKKFPFAAKMYFTKDGLEQSSSQVISEYRTERFAGLKGVVYDLGCGIGIDGINIAKTCTVIGIDKNEKRLEYLRLNAIAYDVQGNITFNNADFTSESFLLELAKRKDLAAIFIDPSRRTDQGARINDYESYEPSLEFVNTLLEITPNICVKAGPGVNYLDLFGVLNAPFDVEIISTGGECREAVLWFGNLRKNADESSQISAVLLPSREIISEAIENLDEELILMSDVLGKYLYEPVGALTRAHLDQKLVEQYDLHRFSQDIIYLTGDNRAFSPFFKSYEIQSVFKYGVNEINEYIRVNSITEVTLKKRGVEIDLDRLYEKLEIPNKVISAESKQQIFIITKVAGDTKVIAVKRIKSESFK